MNKLDQEPSYPITPVPGWLVVAKEAKSQCPVFINICSHHYIPLKDPPIVFTLPCRIHRNEWNEDSLIYDTVVNPSTIHDILKIEDKSERLKLQYDLSTKVVDLLMYQGELGDLILMANGSSFAIDNTMKYKYTTSHEVSEVHLPGTEPVVAEEEAAAWSLCGSLLITLKRAFEDSVPMNEILDLQPDGYMYVTGIAAIMLTAGVFIFLMMESFTQQMGQEYLALSPSDGGTCTEVTRSVSGSFSADSEGNWQGFDGFSNPGVQYIFELRQSAMTTVDYSGLITDLFAEMATLGKMSAGQDLVSNLILLSTWNFHCDPRTATDCSVFEAQTIRMSAEAPIVFSLSSQVAGLSSNGGNCHTSAAVKYYLPSAQYTFIVNSAVPDASSTCQGIAGLQSRFGYNSAVDGSTFKIVVDVRTFASGISVNKGFGSLRAQPRYEIILSAGKTTISHSGHTYTAAYYIDQTYPGMSPLLCIVDSELPTTIDEYPLTQLTSDGLGVNQLCMIQVGEIVLLPLLHHYGDNPKDKTTGAPLDSPRPCTCDKYGHEAYCSAFDLMFSFVVLNNVYGNATIAEQVEEHITMVVGNAGYDILTNEAYNASFAIAANANGGGASADPVINSTRYRVKSYAFCGGKCALFTMNAWGSAVLDTSITSFMHVLTNGSCGDVFTIPEADITKMNVEPTPFIESYYVCIAATTDALIEAVGVASGTAGTLLPLVITIALLFVRKWLKMNGYMLGSPEYDRTDITDKGKEFMECLMTVNGMDPDKPVVHHHRVTDPHLHRNENGFLALSDEIWTEPAATDDEPHSSAASQATLVGHQLISGSGTATAMANTSSSGWGGGGSGGPQKAVPAPVEVHYLSDSESSTEGDGGATSSTHGYSSVFDHGHGHHHGEPMYDELSFNSADMRDDSLSVDDNDDEGSDGLGELFGGDGRSSEEGDGIS